MTPTPEQDPAVPATEAPAPAPADRGLTGLVLHAARDIGKVGTAFDAEMLLSTLLGSIYTGLLPDRAPAAIAFAERLAEDAASDGSSNAVLTRAVLSGLRDDPAVPSSGSSPLLSDAPAWAACVGDVEVTGAYAYGDRFGDQTGYVATFAYRDPVAGGDEHAVVVLVDHNLGLAKDIVVAPAGPMLDGLRSSVATDPDAMIWFSDVPATAVRAAGTAYIALTDAAATLPDGEFADNRALAQARLARLPAATEPAPPADPAEEAMALVSAFLSSPEAELAGFADRTGDAHDSLAYCLSVICGFGTTRGDALRWSPAGVETFLLSWVHERALLDKADARTMPDALRAWVTWSARRIGLPDAALAETLATLRAAKPEFTRLYASGERQSPAARAMAKLVADGVDIDDPEAVDAWLRVYNEASG